MRTFRGFFACVHISGCATIACGQDWPTLYVDGEIAESGDGAYWATAYKTIQEALVYACPTPGGSCYDLTICVKGGSDAYDSIVYTPGTASSDTFLIVNRVLLLGGFPGEDELESPDPGNHPTILSGDLGSSTYAEHVVTMTGDDSLLSGFIIESGRAEGASSTSYDEDGGGILIVSASPTVEYCTIRENDADGRGAGVFIAYGSPTIEASMFEGNDAVGNGGGLYVYFSEPEVTLCDFSANDAARGGGVAIEACSDDCVLSGCTFIANGAANRGGGA